MVTKIKFYENHAQDARVKPITGGVCHTIGAREANSPGSTGNNPIVLKLK